jgi:hypothetical protein
MFCKFGLRDNSAAVVHQVGQHAEFVSSHFYRNSITGNPSRARIDDHGIAAKFNVHLTARSSYKPAHSCQQFLHTKGFADIIVCSTIYALNFLVPGSARSQDQDWSENTSFTPSTDQR